MRTNKAGKTQQVVLNPRAKDISDKFYAVHTLASELHRFLTVRSIQMNAELLEHPDNAKALAKKRDHLTGLAHHWREISKLSEYASLAFYEGENAAEAAAHPLDPLATEFLKWQGVPSQAFYALRQLPDPFLSIKDFVADPFAYEPVDPNDTHHRS